MDKYILSYILVFVINKQNKSKRIKSTNSTKMNYFTLENKKYDVNCFHLFTKISPHVFTWVFFFSVRHKLSDGNDDFSISERNISTSSDF